MAENSHLNGKVDNVDSVPSSGGKKQSPTKVTVCCEQASKNCVAKSQHGMVSVTVVTKSIELFGVCIFF